MKNIQVVFYIEEQANNEVVAFFPEEALNNGQITGYAHLGQHFECDLEYYFAQSQLATKKEYESLLKELQFIYENKLIVLNEE